MRLRLALATLASSALLLAGCGGQSDTGDGAADEAPVESQSPNTPDEPESGDDGDTESGDEEGDGDDGCFIHFFDGDDFDETDDNFKLTEPGEYENLADLPGADKDWTDEADSLKVGPDATVTIYDEENFEGTSQELDPGTEIADVDDEPQSLKMSCE